MLTYKMLYIMTMSACVATWNQVAWYFLHICYICQKMRREGRERRHVETARVRAERARAVAREETSERKYVSRRVGGCKRGA